MVVSSGSSSTSYRKRNYIHRRSLGSVVALTIIVRTQRHRVRVGVVGAGVVRAGVMGVGMVGVGMVGVGMVGVGMVGVGMVGVGMVSSVTVGMMVVMSVCS